MVFCAAVSSVTMNSVFTGNLTGLHPVSTRHVIRSPSYVVVAGKREEQLTDIRKMTTDAINQAVVDSKGELFLLSARKARKEDYRPSQRTYLHKSIARMLTVKREREIERGVSCRESRKLDRAWRKSVVPAPPPSYNPADWTSE